MKHLLLPSFIALIIPFIANGMEPLPPAHAGPEKYPALIFLKVIDQSQKDLAFSINHGTIGSLKESIQNKYFEKAIPFTHKSLAPYGNGDFWNLDVFISCFREKKLVQTHLDIQRSSLSWMPKLSFKLKGNKKQELAHHAIDIEPRVFADVCLVTLKLAGEHLEQSTMEVLHRKSNYFAQMLRECGANLNGVNPHERAPLMKAALDGDSLQFLLKAGADVHAQCPKTKTTALHIAAEWGCLESVVALLEHGAVKDIDLQDQDGCTPLHCAVLVRSTKRNGKEIVQQLVKAGANLLIRNKVGFYPYGFAMKWAETHPDRMQSVLEILRQAHVDRHHAYTKKQSVLNGLTLMEKS